MDNFFYHVPTDIYFGKGQIEHLGARMAQLSKNVLLVYGGGSIKRIGLYDQVIAQLKGAGIEYVELSGVEPNPRITSVRRACGEGGRRQASDRHDALSLLRLCPRHRGRTRGCDAAPLPRA